MGSSRWEFEVGFLGWEVRDGALDWMGKREPILERLDNMDLRAPRAAGSFSSPSQAGQRPRTVLSSPASSLMQGLRDFPPSLTESWSSSLGLTPPDSQRRPCSQAGSCLPHMAPAQCLKAHHQLQDFGFGHIMAVEPGHGYQASLDPSNS
jgi:hypothetical protein